MRHSDPKLTANVYTDLQLLDVAAAVEALAPAGPVLQWGRTDEGTETCISYHDLWYPHSHPSLTFIMGKHDSSNSEPTATVSIAAVMVSLLLVMGLAASCVCNLEAR